ncbi:Phosphonate-transporting ATPase [Flexistipes sinusarabici DSM 4947]|uniref:Phosphonate-transporting ATPase n=1 Tax=Flexistipes sinusarabici (strain ATCC 49648 / DSM 4947 / MAS 10) TaxID=717231 RepID=F8E6L6_FLESM|nr:ABC transporter ATP-binding protein [Flexistipes sinusarabici]AEI14853.1 Phosphonate-transporting ATPase [Flexistipes sinusarabici DSM 4947]
MLKVSSLNIYYGAVRALNNISIHVKEKEFVSLIGSNGAGKTSLLNGILNIVPPKSGEIVFQNRTITGLPTKKKVKMGISLVPEGRRVFPNMSVHENLEMGGYQKSSKIKNRQMEFVLDLFPILKERNKQLAGMLSGGEQQMLAIGRALMSDPKLLLMDEPSMGLAPLVIKNVYEKLTKLKENGLTIFLVEQNASVALKYADRGYVLENGKIVLQGKSSELKDDNEIKRAYLGKEYKEKWER